MKLWISRDKLRFLYASSEKLLYDGISYYGVEIIEITDNVTNKEFEHVTLVNSPQQVELRLID